jgi:xylulokinase
MYSIGYDIGSSSIKCTILEIETGKVASSGSYPNTEMKISSPAPGWAEQDPELWWEYVVTLTRKALSQKKKIAANISSIGISYQMHGLVCVDNAKKVLRPSIIWCDSRAVQIGQRAFENIGTAFCLEHLLNSPGNFTASKLRWVKENEPDVYRKIHKVMLPGDYIAMRLTSEIVTTFSGLTEGIFWDFQSNSVSHELLKQYEIDENILPTALPSFSVQGRITKKAAAELGIPEETPVSYRAGDQPNNAFSLNVLNPGEIAATAGTSGVVYAVSDSLQCDRQSRINAFSHVNHTGKQTRIGILLCINGTGIALSWIRKITGKASSNYTTLNRRALRSPVGSNGLVFLPFGNGAERMFGNREPGAAMLNLDFNRHSQDDLLRAVQEGVAFSFIKGIGIMKEMGVHPSVIRAGSANMFLSPLFTEALATVGNVAIELYNTDGAQGAARGAAFGAGFYPKVEDAFKGFEKVGTINPNTARRSEYEEAYRRWGAALEKLMK